MEQKVYYLTPRGSDSICRNHYRLKRSEIDHALMRNDLYIRLGCPNTWVKENPVEIDGEVFLIPDAMYFENNTVYFIEVDNRQSMRTNNDKIKRYKKLFDMYDGKCTLIWYTLSDVRKSRLKATCDKYGVNAVVY